MGSTLVCARVCLFRIYFRLVFCINIYSLINRDRILYGGAGVPPSPPDRILRMQISQARMSYRQTQRQRQDQRACHILSLHKYLRRVEWIRTSAQKCIAIRNGRSFFGIDISFLSTTWIGALRTSVNWCITNSLWRHGFDVNGKCRYANWIRFTENRRTRTGHRLDLKSTQSDIEWCWQKKS